MSEGQRQGSLAELVAAIADGKSVDWDEVRSSNARLGAKLDILQGLESLRSVHGVEAADAVPETRDAFDGSSWGHLRVLERLGSGGFGDVYRAHDPRLERDVALKLQRADRAWDARQEELFLDEARRLARVRHTNVLIVHGAEKNDGRVGLWAELIEGKTLEELLDDRGRMGAHEATLVGLDLCRALAAVHAEGLVHRDVKTGNVIREDGGRIVLLDFSAVTELRPNGKVSGPSSGTPLFMPPEMLVGTPSGVAGDVYALGVVLYRLTTDQFPVEAASLEELRACHERGTSVPLRDRRPDLPMPFVQVVDRALAHDPAARYASAGEMERALAGVLGPGHEAAPRTPTPTVASIQKPAEAPRVETSARRSHWPIVMVSVLVVAALAAWFGWPTTEYRVDAQWFRSGPMGADRLGPGTPVRPGDGLFLEIEGSSLSHVYVLNADDRGEGYVLFPLATLDLQNPLPPGTAHRLPGPIDGRQQRWDVTSVGGTETLLVVAAREPLDTIERAIGELPAAGAGRSDHLAQVRTLMRGVGGLSTDEPYSAAAAGSASAVGALAYGLRSSRRDEVWVWELRLSNPGS